MCQIQSSEDWIDTPPLGNAECLMALFCEFNHSACCDSLVFGVDEIEGILVCDVDIDDCPGFSCQVSIVVHIGHSRLT